MFSKVLIANRGEIAVRIIRACKEMGVQTVAVYSTADREGLHVGLADESVCIGGNTARESYLNMDAVLSAAVCTGADAIHPGYGFLSENERFADLCRRCGITFVGPPAEIIRKMGNKEAARRTMQKAGVPVIPGSDVLATAEEALAAAEGIGYPLLCKARSGGGGRGIRLVQSPDDLAQAFRTASGEAQAAFGDGGIYLEKFLRKAKHIEMQILCDGHGTVLCLGERDCSAQRKNQKMLEESPSVAVDGELRRKMAETTVRAAHAVGYESAGTIEYLLDSDGNFYFMEMNTRLQVEHPVTEMISGVDLVKWQLRIASGAKIPIAQEDIRLDGYALECRILAEDAKNGFRPSCGTIKTLHVPGGPWVRFDSAIYQDYKISPFYDSMVGKLIVHAGSREEAVRKMKAALCELVIEGIETNIDYLMDLLDRPEFIDGSYCTDFIGK